jgi:hypothetical protein
MLGSGACLYLPAMLLVYRLLSLFRKWGICGCFPGSLNFIENLLAIGVPDVAFWF